MTRNFKVRDYVKEGVNVCDVYDQWVDDRGADGCENAFDLTRTGDFKMFVDMHGIEKTIQYYETGRIYLDGINFKEPVDFIEDTLWNILNDELDLDYFRWAEREFGNIEYWRDYIDVDKIKELLGIKKKYVIRHYWKSWVDIPVEADSLDEAFEIAGEMYNEGDYEENPENIMNTDVQNVTELYD